MRLEVKLESAHKKWYLADYKNVNPKKWEVTKSS